MSSYGYAWQGLGDDHGVVWRGKTGRDEHGQQVVTVWHALDGSKPRSAWTVYYTLIPSAGTLVIREIRIAAEPAGWPHQKIPRPEPPAPVELTARAMRAAVRPGEAIQQARQCLTGLTVDRPDDWSPLPSDWAFTAEVIDAPRQVGRGGRPDRYYAEYAAAYVAASEGGGSPIRDVARQRGESSNYVRDVIHECRPARRGLLTEPPAKGKAGGQLTEKALRILHE
jgi:hypothetical protein